jgi:hypothetical protein
MRELEVENFTLTTWLGQIWTDYRRGVPQFGQNAVLLRCMLHHTMWRTYWDALATGDATGMTEVSQNAIIHVNNDAMVISQCKSGNPAALKAIYDMLEIKGFDEFTIIHTIGVALVEETAYAKEHGEKFNVVRYVEIANRYAKELLARPNLARSAKAKLY